MQAECWVPSTVHKLSIPAMHWHLEWFTTLPIPKVHNSTTFDKLSMQFELLVSLGHRNHPTLDFHLDGIEEQSERVVTTTCGENFISSPIDIKKNGGSSVSGIQVNTVCQLGHWYFRLQTVINNSTFVINNNLKAWVTSCRTARS